MVKALIITLACLGFFAGCGSGSQKTKTVKSATTLDPDLKISIPDKKNEEDLNIPSIPDERLKVCPDLNRPDLLKNDLESRDEVAATEKTSIDKKATPSAVPWPKGMGPQGSSSSDSLNMDDSSRRVQNELDSLAQGAEKKTDTTKVDPNDLWQKLVDVIAETGESQESRMGFYVSRSEFTPENKNEAHVANHISVIGGPKSDGTFGYSRVEASWEDWKMTSEGYWDGDLWMFLISRDGNLAKFWRYNLVKKTNGTVIKHQGSEITQEMADKKWLEIKEMWTKKLVK